MSGRKKRIPKPMKVPSLINKAIRFATVHGVLDQIENNEIDVAIVNGKEVPIYYDRIDSGWHELVPALEGWLEFLKKAGQWVNYPARTDAHYRVIECLKNDAPFHPNDLKLMRTEILQHEDIYMRCTPEQRREISRTCQLMFALQNAEQAEKEKQECPEPSLTP